MFSRKLRWRMPHVRMSIRLRLVISCLVFLVVVGGLGYAARQRQAALGEMALGIYDSAFMSLVHIQRAEAAFTQLLIAVERAPPAEVTRLHTEVLDNLYIAIERAMKELTRNQAKALLGQLHGREALALVAGADATERAFGQLVRRFAADGLAARDDIEAFVAASDRFVTGTVGATLILVLLVNFTLIRTVMRPMRRAADLAIAIAGGKLDNPIGFRPGGDESKLFKALSEMQTAVAGMIGRLEASNAESTEQAATAAARAAQLDALSSGFEIKVRAALDGLDTAAITMGQRAGTMVENVGATKRSAAAVSRAADQTAASVQQIATSTEDMAVSAGAIGQRISAAAAAATAAAAQARQTDAVVRGLVEAAGSIGQSVRLITEIAGRTNLLALNATIEAARAGDAGKGFAIVASEVKNLAAQTGQATGAIAEQVQAIQGATEQAVTAIRAIGMALEDIEGSVNTVAEATEQQVQVTRGMAQGLHGAAGHTADVSSTIGSVDMMTGETGEAAHQVLAAADDVDRQAALLRSEVDGFLAGVRAA